MGAFVINTIISFIAFSALNRQDDVSLYSSPQVISLSLLSPSLNWDITSNSTDYVIEVSKILENPLEEDEDVKISLIIEEMSCVQDNHEGPFLSIQGANKSLKICSNLNNSKGNFQTVREFFDNEESIKIIPEGNWNNGTQVRLVVSVYIEKESCDKCPDNFFCCGTKSSCMDITCENSELIINRLVPEKVRCIPVIDNSTLCNGHPNCGFFCNPDEIPAICQNPWNYTRDETDLVLDIVESSEDSSAENIEVVWVWNALLFFTTCLFLLASLVIITSLCNSILQKGFFSKLCICKLQLPNIKPSKNYQGNLTTVSSFKYSDEYI